MFISLSGETPPVSPYSNDSLVFKNNADVPNSHLLHAVENLSNKLVQSTAIRPFQNYDTGFYSIPDELKLIIF